MLRVNKPADSHLISGTFDLQTSGGGHSACIAFKVLQMVVLLHDLEAILALWSPLGYQKSQRSNANHPHLNILPIFKSYPMKLPFEIFEFN